MASRKIEADVVVKVTGTDDLNEAADTVKELSDTTTHVEVQVEGEENVRKLQEQFKGLDNVTVTAAAKIDGDAKVQAFIQQVRSFDNETATAVLAVRAGQAQDTAEKLIATIGDINSTEVQVKVASEALPQAKADLDALNGEMARLNEEAGRTGGGLRQVGAAAGEAGGIVSNAFGNAAQDIAGMAGVTGTAGQAVGQMAEQFVTAASGAGGLAAGLSAVMSAALPIVGIGAVLGIVTSMLGEYQAAAEESAERTKQFGEAMRTMGDDALGFSDVFRQNEDSMRHFAASANSNLGDFGIALEQTFKKIPLLGMLVDETSTDIVSAMSKAGISVYEFSAAIEDQQNGMASYIAKLQEAKDAGRITGEEFRAMKEHATESSAEVRKAAEAQGLWAVSTEELNALMGEAQDPLVKYADQFRKIKDDMRDGKIDFDSTTASVNELAAAIGKTPDEVRAMAQAGLDEELEKAAEAAEAAAEAQAEMNAAVRDGKLAMMDAAAESEAFATAMEQMNALAPGTLDFSLMAFKTQDAFDAVKDSLEAAQKEGVKWSEVDLTPDTAEELKNIPDHLQAITEGMAGMRESIQAEMQAAFDAGGIEGFIGKAQAMAAEIGPEFKKAFMDAGASASEADAKVHELLDGLGLLPEQVAVQIQLTRTEEARNALEAFSGFIDTLSEPKQIAIHTAIAEGDIAGAYDMLNRELILRGYDPIVLPVDADMQAANDKLHFWETSADGTTGTGIFDADKKPADDKLTAWHDAAAGLWGNANLDANDGLAWDKLGGWKQGADSTTAEVTVDANKKPADDKVEGVKTKAEQTKPIIDIGANTAAAITTMLLINAIAKAMAPVVTVGANTFPAIGAVAAAVQVMNSMHARVAVDAYLRNVPSASDIASRIGVVRVPIDAYVRTMPRINGNP